MATRTKSHSPKKTDTPYPTSEAAQALACEEMKAAEYSVASAFRHAYRSSPVEKIAEIRSGVPVTRLNNLAQEMALPPSTVTGYLGLARSGISRKANEKPMLTKEAGALVIGIESLIGQVDTMVAESGDPTGFSAAQWVASWISTPNPVMGGVAPSTFMDTIEGQQLVAGILAMAQTSAYA